MPRTINFTLAHPMDSVLGQAPLMQYRTGRYYTPPFAGGTSLTSGTANIDTIYFLPFPILEQVAISEICANVTTANSNGTLTLGIYSADENGKPRLRVWGASGISLGATGRASASPQSSIPLQPGLYFLASLQTGGAAACSVHNIATRDCFWTRSNVLNGADRIYALPSASYLPSTVNPISSNETNAPLLWFKP